MKILVVGNVIKDVYLNLDTRTENLETDRAGTDWLDLCFNASEHHFYSRASNYGGAAISLEVLQKMDLNAEIADSDFHFDATGPVPSGPTETYRYILTSDTGTTYFTPTDPKPSFFSTPTTPVDYIYVDRSAVLTPSAIDRLIAYLDYAKNTKLVLYLKNPRDTALTGLIHRASLVFLENNRGRSEKPSALPSKTAPKNPNASLLTPEKTIYLSDRRLSYLNVSESLSVTHLDRLTHLSAYSIIAATILGGFILGKTVEFSLKIARLNAESSTLSSTLALPDLETLAMSTTRDDLELTAANLLLPKKGILAADESGGSIRKKFAKLQIDDTFENRHNYRDIFFTTPDIENYLSGVILFDETARDYAENGQTYPDFLVSKQIIPGIKVDQGLATFPNSTETYTTGLENLETRVREYYQMGLRFAKWRAAFNITFTGNQIETPTPRAIEENCQILGEYAKICQQNGLVPIVEPEVVYDGNYSIEQNAAVSSAILDKLFETLYDMDVNLHACILKTNMILAGKQYYEPSTPDEVGRATAEVLKNHVPSELAGVVFLSGGQTPEQATENLAAIIAHSPYPWPVTFSFARALQDPSLYTWRGDSTNVPAARDALTARLKANAEIL